MLEGDILSLNNVFLSWQDWESLGRDFLSGLLGFLLFLIVFSNSGFESFSAVGELHVFSSHVNSLSDDSVSNSLGDNDTDSSRVDVENLSGLSVVRIVWHALVNGGIDDNINVISDSEGGQGLGDVDGSSLSEWLGDFRSGSGSVTPTVWHLLFSLFATTLVRFLLNL